MMRRKRTIVRPVLANGLVSPEILVEVSAWRQVVKLTWEWTRNGLAIVGFVTLVSWIL